MPHTEAGVGYRTGDTSSAAARDLKGKVVGLRRLVMWALKDRGPMTPDQIAVAVSKSILSIRPRVTELASFGLVEDTGERRENASGKKAVVWRLTEVGRELSA